MNPAADPSPGFPGWFIALMVLGGLASLGIWWWRYSVTRDLARRAGFDDGDANKVALFGRDGIDTALLASTIRHSAQPHPEPRSAAARLKELENLKLVGAITQVEYETRRQQILDSI